MLQIQPFGDSIGRCFQVFVDERDEGQVIMTHLYLLVGCSCPLWLHNGCVMLRLRSLETLGKNIGVVNTTLTTPAPTPLFVHP